MNLAELGQRVAARRERLGWSQEQLAQASDLSASYVSRLERGQAGAKVEDLLKIVQALGARLGDIAGETDGELQAQIRASTPEGDLVIGLQRIAHGYSLSPEQEQAHIRAAVNAIAALVGGGTETPSAN